MQRINPAYLYNLGKVISQLSQVKEGDDFQSRIVSIATAGGALDLLYSPESLYKFKSSVAAARDLRNVISNMILGQHPVAISDTEAISISSTLSKWETVFQYELATAPAYMVVPTAGYDTDILIENGLVLFPLDILKKAPEAEFDIREATRCIAFSLPTAAAFHIHRVNEAVLSRYYDAVGNPAKKPAEKNMGVVLRALREQNAGSKKVLDRLQEIKDDHRNPIIHPEDRLDDLIEAVALLHVVHAAIVYMLREITTTLADTLPAASTSTPRVLPAPML